MLKIKNLRGECQNCGGPIEFHAEHAGTTASCPHCSETTELLLATPPEETSPVRRKAVVFTVIAVLILVGGLVGSVIALKRAKRLQAERQRVESPGEIGVSAAVAAPFAAQEFRVSAIILEPRPGSSLLNAVGTISNLANRQRFGVQVDLEVYSATGEKVGVANDYLKVLEPGGEWQFRALVGANRAATAQIIRIKESQ
jgi:hypothetical protein